MSKSRKRDKGDSDETKRALQKAAAESSTARYVLTLYVAGMTRRSAAAVEGVKKFCEEHLKGRYELEVVDVYRHPELAREVQVIAAPTLIKTLPLPLKRLIGNMRDEEKILVGLEVKPKDGEEKQPR